MMKNKFIINKLEILKIYTDGDVRVNPDPAASVFLLVHNDNIIHDECAFNGTAINNIAEYQAIINVLKFAEKFSRGHLQVYSDSNLAIQQINKKWKINYPHLSKLCSEVISCVRNTKRWIFFMSEGLILTFENVIYYVMNDWMMKGLNTRNFLLFLFFF
jgi:ribonuclease HI